MSKKWTKEQLDKNFEAFLKESMTDSDVTESIKKSKSKRGSVLDKLGQTPSPPSSVQSSTGKQWWMVDSVDDDDDFEIGNSTKSFLKSTAILPEEPQQGDGDKLDYGIENDVATSNKQSVTAMSEANGGISASPFGQPGMETIQEEQEKETFFKQIESNVSDEKEVNYAKLNADLGNSSTGMQEKKKMLGNVSFLTSNGTLQSSKDDVKVEEDEKGLEDSLPHDSTAEANMEELQKMLKEAGMSTFGSSFPDLGKTSNTLKDTLPEPEVKQPIEEDQSSEEIFSSTPANNKQKKDDKVMYGFELSPVHSADINGTQAKEFRGFDLSPAHSSVYKEDKRNIESGDDLEKIEKIFTENVADRGSAPNFMQAKLASPRLSKTIPKKSGINEETETMMSQVYSSQDGSIISMQHKHHKKKKASAGDGKKTYSAYQRGRFIATPEKPYAHVESSGYGIASPMSRKDSVRVSPTRKKSPSPKRKKTPKNNITKTKNVSEKPMEEKSKSDNEKRKTVNGNTFVLAPNIFRQPIVDGRKDGFEKRQPKSKRRPLRSPKDSYENESQILDTVRSLAHLLHAKEKIQKEDDEVKPKASEKETKRKDSAVEGRTDWQDKWNAEHNLVAQLKSELNKALSIAEMYKNENEKLNAEFKEIKTENNKLNNELEKIRKENYVINSKLNYTLMKSKVEVEEKNVFQKKEEASSLSADNEEDSSRSERRKTKDDQNDDISKLKQNLAEQEKLISGYQQENERIYLQLKQAVKSNKDNEDAMYEENRVLKAEIASLKEVLNEKNLIQKRNAVDQLQGFNRPQEYEDFTEDIKKAKTKIKNLEFQLQTEVGLHNKTKTALRNVQKQCDEFEKKLGSGMERQGMSLENSKNKYEKEITALKDRLKWYAENQLLLDKDQEKLKNQKTEIEELRVKVAEMSKIVRMRSTAAKDKEQKKIQDLQRQVKELEKILHSRQNPDSVQALVFAAAQNKDGTMETKPQSYWEAHAKKLQVKLEDKDKETAITVRSVQQQYNKMKLQYETEIDNLERQVRTINRLTLKAENVNGEIAGNSRESTGILKMEQQMKQERELFERSKDNFEKQIEYLQLCLKEHKTKTPKQTTSSPSKLKTKQLEERYALKVGEIEKLNDVISALKLDNEILHKKMSENANKKTNTKKTAKSRQYDPTTFQGEHFTDMTDENKNLQKLVEELKIGFEKERILKQGVMATAEKDMRIVREEYESKIEQIKQDYSVKHNPYIEGKKQEEIDAFKNQIAVQQEQISVMQERINQLKAENKQVETLKRKEQALQHQIKNLLLEIHSTKMGSKDTNTKSIALLECKLKSLEERHNLKEKELRLALSGNTNAAAQTEIIKLENLVNAKNAQILQFRNELDSILMVLQELKSQGVVIHAPKHMTSLLK